MYFVTNGNKNREANNIARKFGIYVIETRTKKS